MLPTTLPEKVCTPVTIEAAKSAPGNFGIESDGIPTDGVDVDDDGLVRNTGS